jgi:hypothetical protein
MTTYKSEAEAMKKAHRGQATTRVDSWREVEGGVHHDHGDRGDQERPDQRVEAQVVRVDGPGRGRTVGSA